MNQSEISLPTLAGFFSTALFAMGTLPMLVKAFRTKNLASYSLGNILMSNVGNIIYSIYVFHLPSGPIWFLHSFYLLSTGLMLIWYLRYEVLPDRLRSAAHPIRSCCHAHLLAQHLRGDASKEDMSKKGGQVNYTQRGTGSFFSL